MPLRVDPETGAARPVELQVSNRGSGRLGSDGKGFDRRRAPPGAAIESNVAQQRPCITRGIETGTGAREFDATNAVHRGRWQHTGAQIGGADVKEEPLGRAPGDRSAG